MNSKQKIFIPFFGIFAAFFAYVCMQANNGIILPSASACEHDGNHYRGQGNLANDSKPETFGHGIQEYYICCKCHEMFFAKDGVPSGKWTPIQDLGESIASQIDENNPRATKLNVGNFLNLNVETIKMSSITGYDHEVAKVDGFGKIGFNGAYFDSDTFLTSYSNISFEVKFDGTYSNNSIHAFGKEQMFKTDGTKNTLDNNFVRIYKDTVETQTISPNVWYTVSINIGSGTGPVASNQLNSIYMEFGEVSHSVTLQSLRFGTTWDSGFQAKKHGISTSDGLTQISRKTIGGEDLFTVYGNGNLYFDDVMNKDNVPGQFFLSNYKYVSFDIYSTYHDAPHAYVPYSDVWMHPTATNWNWSSYHSEGLFVKSYQNQVEVDTFNVDQWYTFNFEIHNNINGAVRFELGATFTYITNVKFSVEPILGEVKTADDKPDYDPLGFALNNTTSTMTKVEEDGKACMKVVTTGKTELTFLDINTKIKQGDNLKAVGGAYHTGYGYFSVDVKVTKGNNFYWVISKEGVWHNATGACNDHNSDYLSFSDLYGNSVKSIMWYNNWYRMKVKLVTVQGDASWCPTWALNDEGGTELYICNLQFYA